jgi:hypothetical protein
VFGDFRLPVNFRANLRNGDTDRDKALDALRPRLFLLLEALGGVKYPLRLFDLEVGPDTTDPLSLGVISSSPVSILRTASISASVRVIRSLISFHR